MSYVARRLPETGRLPRDCMSNPQCMPLPASAWPVAEVGDVWRMAIMDLVWRRGVEASDCMLPAPSARSQAIRALPRIFA